MAASVVEIYNRALSKIGHTIQLVTGNEANVEAQQCVLHYAPCRNMVLEEHDWSFATHYAELTALVTPSDREDWAYEYTAPADMLRPLAILPAETRNGPLPAEARYPYQVEANAALDGQVIYTDLEDAWLAYVAKSTAFAAWPESFVDAVATRLAVELALSIKKDANLAQRLLVAFQVALGKAKRADLRSAGRNEAKPLTPSIAARG